MRRLPTLFILAVVLLGTALRVQAQAPISAEDALWQVNIHVEKLFASPLGAMINDVIHKEAPDGKLNVDAFVEAMGMDPRTAIKEIVVFGDDFEPNAVRAVANIGSTRGNIEGWLLAAPGYQSEAINDTTILHSFIVEKHGPQARLWSTISFNKTANTHLLVATFDRDTTLALAKYTMEQGIGKFGDKLAGDTMLAVAVNDLSRAPIEIDEHEPGSAIIKTIQSVVLSAMSEGDQLVTSCKITTDNPARAQQLNQLIMGMKAMVQLALPEKNPKGEHVAKMLANLNVKYAEGSEVISARFAMDYAEIEKLIELKHKIK